MKIKINTADKKIELEQSVNLDELFVFFKRVFPEGEWKLYSLEAVMVINNWAHPIYIEDGWHKISKPWWTHGLYTICHNDKLEEKPGVFCIETAKTTA